jgi:hypothetical protein
LSNRLLRREWIHLNNYFRDIIRYDGTRFITEEEIDREFTSHWVLIRIDDDTAREGYLVASADGRDELRPMMSEISILEFDAKTKVIYGCKTRGDNLHVELLS